MLDFCLFSTLCNQVQVLVNTTLFATVIEDNWGITDVTVVPLLARGKT